MSQFSAAPQKKLQYLLLENDLCFLITTAEQLHKCVILGSVRGGDSETFDHRGWSHPAAHTGTSQTRFYILSIDCIRRCLFVPGNDLLTRLSHPVGRAQ